MGLFDFLRSRGRNNSSRNVEPELPRLKRKSFSATVPELPRLKRKASPPGGLMPSGTYEDVEIVGETFYVDSFKLLRDELSLGARDEASVEVELINEPDNPNEPSGKAVAVFVLNRKVGHVSKHHCQFVFDELVKSGGRRKFQGRIYFGDLRQNPPKNSVSIKFAVQTKSPEETRKIEEKYQREQEKREQAEADREEFLKSPVWSTHTLVDGDRVTFTGFSQFMELDKLTSLLLPSEPTTGVHLLVVHPRMLPDSAKLRNWLRGNKPVTDLHNFLENNPNFGQYFNRSTGEFDMPESVTGKKRAKVEPPKATITFESDENLGSNKPLPAEIVRLPQQTLAKYPTFTLYGSYNFRLSDFKKFEEQILQLFEEVQAARTDAILLKGRLQEVEFEGSNRLGFMFREQVIGLVPKNETQRIIREGKSWKAHATVAMISLDYKGVIRGAHDSGLGEGFFRR